MIACPSPSQGGGCAGQIHQGIACLSERGWALEKKDGKVTLLTPFGKRQAFELNDKPKSSERGNYSYTRNFVALAIVPNAENESSA